MSLTRRTSKSPRPAGVAEADVARPNTADARGQLLLQENRSKSKSKGDRSKINAARAEEVHVILREQREQMAAMAATMEEMLEHSHAVQRNVQSGTSLTSRVLKRTNEILSVSRNIHGITTQTLAGVKNLQRRARAGDTSLFRDIIMNEWLALISIFLAYPHFPVTMEIIAPLWASLLSVNFTNRTIRSVARREITLFSQGGPIRWTYQLVTSAPHAIFLIWQLSSRLNAAKRGSTAFGPVNAQAFSQAYANTNVESVFLTTFQDVLANCRAAFDFSKTADATPVEPVQTVPYYEAMLTRMYDERTKIVEEIRAMDPEGTMFRDWTGFLNLLARYLAGKLYYTTATGMAQVIRAPAYLYQASLLADSETFLLMTIFQFINDILGGTLVLVKQYIKQLLCMPLCNLKYYLAPTGDSWSVSGTVQEVFKAGPRFAISLLLNSMGCPCKEKQDGGKLSASTRKRKFKGGVLPERQAEIIVLAWDCLILFAASANPEMKKRFDIDSAKLAQIEANGSEIMNDLILANKYVPNIWFDGIEQFSGVSGEPFLLTQ